MGRKLLPLGVRTGDADRVTGISEVHRQLGKMGGGPISCAAVGPGVEENGRLPEGLEDALDHPVRMRGQ